MIGRKCGNKICKQGNLAQSVLLYSTKFVSGFPGPLFLGNVVYLEIWSHFENVNAYLMPGRTETPMPLSIRKKICGQLQKGAIETLARIWRHGMTPHLGGLVVQRLEHWTQNCKVVGLIPISAVVSTVRPKSNVVLSKWITTMMPQNGHKIACIRDWP